MFEDGKLEALSNNNNNWHEHQQTSKGKIGKQIIAKEEGREITLTICKSRKSKLFWERG